MAGSYINFFLNSPAAVRELELLAISHPNFTQIYRVVRNKVGGVDATIDVGVRHFDYYPLAIQSKGTRADMDYSLQITLGDLGDIIETEMDAVAAADGWMTRPTVRYWTFRSDDLSVPLFGPITLQVVDFPMTREGTSFVAAAPSLNVNRCGELYLPARFSMLSGLL
jgi:hypothetical protein